MFLPLSVNIGVFQTNNTMKELLLQAMLDSGHSGATPSDLCRWLVSLTGELATEPGSFAPLLYHTPCPGVLEVWLRDAPEQTERNVLRYRRLSFRPLPPVSAFSPSASADCGVAVEVLPAKQIYIGFPVSEMGFVGASPVLVTTGGWVIPYEALSPVQIGHLDAVYAVLTPALSARLDGAGCVERHMSAPSGPYEALWQEVEGLLARCFPSGGVVSGCPLHLSLRMADVPAHRLRCIGAEHSQLQFGRSAVETDPRTGLCRYGACLPGRCRSLALTMLYPRGQLDAARHLFSLFSPLASLIAVMPVGNMDRWIAYDADERAADQLTQALYTQPVTDVPAAFRLYCLVFPSGEAAAALMGRQLSVRLRRLVLSLGSLYVGAIPLHAVSSGGFGRYLPSVASRLLVQMGGMPWMPRRFASQDTDLIAGFSCSRPSQCFESFSAVTFYNHPARGGCFDLCKAEGKFSLFFSSRFRRAYEQFLTDHRDSPPRRLVVYCHRDLPTAALLSLVRWMVPYSEAVPVVLAQVRRTSRAMLRHYAPDAPGCMPPAGTVLGCTDDTFLLFCRDFRPASGSLRVFYPYPLEIRLNHLCADGSLQPLSSAEADGVLVQAFQLVRANPACVDGNPLPLVLSHTDRLLRHRCQEWQLEMADRIAMD